MKWYGVLIDGYLQRWYDFNSVDRWLIVQIIYNCYVNKQRFTLILDQNDRQEVLLDQQF